MSNSLEETKNNTGPIDYKAAFERERALRIELSDEVTDLKNPPSHNNPNNQLDLNLCIGKEKNNFT